MENKPKVLTQKYDIGRCIGQGTFAKVYFARTIGTNQSVAIKVIDKEKIFRSGLVEQIKREISVMKLVKHPNIVKLYEVMATKSKIYFVMEFAKGGELFHKVSRGKLREDVARKFFKQLIEAVDFCHNRGVFHRDIKPENLLLDEHENLKVSDFGLSALADSKRLDGLLHTTCGTPAYVAPEVINRKGYDGAKADVWSCGVVLFVLLAGYLPFHDPNLIEMYKKITRADFKFPGWFSPDVRRLLLQILEPNPATRISVAKIKETPWYNKESNAKSVRNEPQTNTLSSLEINGDGPSGNCCLPSEKEKSLAKLPVVNAFDIISHSAGFDLSRLFEDNSWEIETRFTSLKPAHVIISKLEEVAERLKLKLVKIEGGLLKLDRTRDGKTGPLLIEVEIFEATPSLHFVEVRKSAGDTFEFQKILNSELKPALEDIVWVWPDEANQPIQLQQDR